MSASVQPDNWPVILVIEDNNNDVFFLRRALTRLSYDCHLRIFGTTSSARAYTENAAIFQNDNYYRCPNLILCDFRLQAGTSLSYIEWLRSDPRFRDIPVVMLSALASNLDRSLFSGLDITAFLRKEGDIEVLGESLRPTLP